MNRVTLTFIDTKRWWRFLERRLRKGCFFLKALKFVWLWFNLFVFLFKTLKLSLIIKFYNWLLLSLRTSWKWFFLLWNNVLRRSRMFFRTIPILKISLKVVCFFIDKLKCFLNFRNLNWWKVLFQRIYLLSLHIQTTLILLSYFYHITIFCISKETLILLLQLYWSLQRRWTSFFFLEIWSILNWDRALSLFVIVLSFLFVFSKTGVLLYLFYRFLFFSISLFIESLVVIYWLSNMLYFIVLEFLDERVNCWRNLVINDK